MNVKLTYEKSDELVLINQSLLKTVDRQYKQLSNAYAGHVKDLIMKVNDLTKDMELKEEKHKNEILIVEKKMELNEEKYKNELLKKENDNNMLKSKLEIEQLKYQLLLSKNNK